MHRKTSVQNFVRIDTKVWVAIAVDHSHKNVFSLFSSKRVSLASLALPTSIQYAVNRSFSCISSTLYTADTGGFEETSFTAGPRAIVYTVLSLLPPSYHFTLTQRPSPCFHYTLVFLQTRFIKLRLKTIFAKCGLSRFIVNRSGM